MEVEALSSKPSGVGNNRREDWENDQVRLKRKTLQTVLEQCQKALESLSDTASEKDNDEGIDRAVVDDEQRGRVSGPRRGDQESDELCGLVKSRVECADFLEKLKHAQSSVPQNIAAMDGSSWDVLSENDLWEDANVRQDKEDYVVVQQEDIVDGIACFMAAYLLSLKETKELSPDKLQEALSKTFSAKKRKGKLRKAWDGSKVIYNVASWGATAVGIYQNPVVLKVASKALSTSFHVISKLL